MNRVADEIERRRYPLAHTLTLDQGKPLHSESYPEVEELIAYWRNAAEDAHPPRRAPAELGVARQARVADRRPLGVVGVITPWNWPYTMPAELIAPALACGNAVVWTPAGSTSIPQRSHWPSASPKPDLPPGVFNLVTGPGSVVGDDDPAIRSCFHSPAFHLSKIKLLCATLCRHRGIPYIIAKSFSQKNFPDSRPGAPQHCEKCGLTRSQE